MFTHDRRVLIEWGDCDPAGIVFYPRYFVFFNASTDALFAAALGMPVPEIMRRHACIGWPMVDTSAQFLVPNGHGVEVRIESCVTELGRSSFKVRHRLWRGELLSVEGAEKRVWVARDRVDPERLKGVPIPDEVRLRLTAAPVAVVAP